MFVSWLRTGSVVIDVDRSTLDLKFLRENGDIDDYFTIIKSSEFRIASTRHTGTNLTLDWEAVPGSVYRLESSATLSPSDWVAVGTPILATAGTATLAVTIDAEAGGRFYRVVDQPVP